LKSAGPGDREEPERERLQAEKDGDTEEEENLGRKNRKLLGRSWFCGRYQKGGGGKWRLNRVWKE